MPQTSGGYLVAPHREGPGVCLWPSLPLEFWREDSTGSSVPSPFRGDCKDLFIYQHGDCEELETCQDAGSQPWHRTKGSPAASSSLHCLPKLPGMPAWATPTCPSEPLLPTGRAPDRAKAAGDRLVYPHPHRVHHQSRPDPRRDPV